MLRASQTCSTAKEIGIILGTLEREDTVTVLQIQPRIGPPFTANEITVNFDYNGQMICEFVIKLNCSMNLPLLER